MTVSTSVRIPVDDLRYYKMLYKELGYASFNAFVNASLRQMANSQRDKKVQEPKSTTIREQEAPADSRTLANIAANLNTVLDRLDIMIALTEDNIVKISGEPEPYYDELEEHGRAVVDRILQKQKRPE